MRAAVRCAALAVVLAWSGSAAAGPSEVMGYDPETGAVANSSMAFGRSLGVLHLNPALLPQVPDQVHAGVLVMAPELRVRLMPKPPGTDVPLSIYDSDLGATPGVKDRAQPTAELPRRRADSEVNEIDTRISFGVASSFGVKKLKVGFLLQMPVGGGTAASVSTNYDDEREAAFTNRVHFTRFGEWQRIVSVLAGVGYEITPRFSVGVAVQLAASATARLRVYIPDAAVQDHANSNLESQVSTRWRPVLGVRWLPTDAVAIGATFRNSSYFEVEGASEVALWNSHEPDPDRAIPRRTTQRFPVTFGYEPMEATLGAGVRAGAVTAQLAATWHRWSAYLDHHSEKQPFNDTLSVTTGATWQMTRRVATSVGGAWYPSPVPAQTGRTNFADSTLLGLTMGERFDFSLFEKRFAISATLQLWHMLTRTTHKDPAQIVDEMPDSVRSLESGRVMPEAAGLQSNNPGFPGYTAGGFLAAGNLALTHFF